VGFLEGEIFLDFVYEKGSEFSEPLRIGGGETHSELLIGLESRQNYILSTT
jgi:hypothetical protein